LGIERMGLASCERFALVSFGPQALDDQSRGGFAALVGRFRSVDEQDRPCFPGAVGDRQHHRALVGRGLVFMDAALLPAVAGGAIGGDPDRPVHLRLVELPGGGRRGVGVLRLDSHDGDVRVGFGRLENHGRVLRQD